MAEALVTMAAAAVLASGIATRYDENVMDVVVANRILYGQIPDYEHQPAHKGYVALLDCEHLGRLVWLQGPRPGSGGFTEIDGPYLVADCAGAKDRDRLKRLEWAVDLSWEVAQEWGVVDDVGRGFVVWDMDPHWIPAPDFVGEPGLVVWR